MGWNLTLTSSKNITIDEVQKIVDDLPEILQGWLKNHKQDWGWSCATDIMIPNDNELVIGGTYAISGHISLKMADYLKDELEKNGHEITISEYW